MRDWAAEVRARIASLNLEPLREASVVEECGQHLRDRFEEMVAGGMSAAQAEQTLLSELGDGGLLEGLKATVRPAGPPLAPGADGEEGFFAGAVTDLRYGARLLLRNPGFAIIAILSLALGIGANTAIFQLLDAVRLRSLPVKAPEQLGAVQIVDSPKCCDGDFYSTEAVLTGALWKAIKEQQQGFAEIAAWSPTRDDLGRGGEARYANTLMVTGNFFHVLGVEPLLGRLISPADDTSGCGARAAVLSYAFWQREFGGRAEALHETVALSGHAFPVIGVTPKNFFGLEVGQNFDVAIALCSQPVFSTKTPLMDNPTAWWLATIGRLKPGWTLKRASTQLAAMAPGIFAATVPPTYDATGRKDYLSFHLGAAPAGNGVSAIRRDYEDPLWLLLGLSGLVLLIACANLANLMLAQASSRQREMALRLTLGASRARLIRQVLAESLLLGGLGTVAGAALAQVLSRVLINFLSTQGNHIEVKLTPDWRVLGFAIGLSLLTCLLFGLAPAIQSARTDPGTAMKASGRGATAGRERFFLRRALVVSQVALSLVLLTGALLFVRTFQTLISMNAGFRQEHLLVASIDYSPLKLAAGSQMAFKRELVERVRAIPGVSSAAETLVVPMSHAGWNNFVDVAKGPQRTLTNFNRVSPGYFQTMETPRLAGRDFGEMDTVKSPRVAIVNETFAKLLFGGGNPVGKVFSDSGKPDQTYEVIGLVKDTKYYELREASMPIVYVSFTQANGPEMHSTLMIRSEEALPALIGAVKRTAGEMNPAMVLEFTVLKTQIREGLLRERLMATLSGFFGGLATVLATIGLYGVISYMVLRRRNEIGIRMALGASRRRILNMILKEAGMLLLLGVAVGLALTFVAGRAAQSLLYGLTFTDPVTLLGSVVGLTLVAILASVLPAQRAASVHPMVALREE
ncbi:ABC transporter, ATP-binding protein [Acidisarcina polymorpha]|uniref:ABC transporter, ATP-binding protein n=1 Tax=Acidisarcina polymorpha TaxID=2211140 RepID=A0A2Z5FX88_9BACT|nr:ABC transporter permease [Acidisarcina polymorpha]AXC11509.1 ABC transporter, ATP-binding protein [Acidisarcina polymorpha]